MTFQVLAWREVYREGKWIFCRRGITGESGWWHDCTTGDWGGNPADYQRTDKTWRCRTCEQVKP